MAWTTEKCPGSDIVVSSQKGPGRHECLDCRQYVPMKDGRLVVHDRDTNPS